jgi:hypothetical protein
MGAVCAVGRAISTHHDGVVRLQASVGASLCLLCAHGATGLVGAGDSEAAAARRIARIFAGGGEGGVVTRGAVGLGATRKLNSHSQRDSTCVGGKVDACEFAGDAVEAGLCGAVGSAIGDDKIKAECPSGGRGTAANVDVADRARSPIVGAAAAQVGVEQISLEEIEAESLADARVERRRRRQWRRWRRWWRRRRRRRGRRR